MRNDSGLGQARGARRIDVDELVVMAHLRLAGFRHAGCREQRIQILGLLDSIRLSVVVLVVELEEGHGGWQIFGNIGDGLNEILAIDQGIAVGHRDAVQQRWAAQIRIDQRRNDANLGQTQPGGHILGAILQQQADHIALLIALRLQHVGHTVRMLVDLTEGPSLCVADDGHLVRMCLHIFLEDIGHGVVETFTAFRVTQQLSIGPKSAKEEKEEQK